MSHIHLLATRYAGQQSQLRLATVARNIARGKPIADRILLDDESIRERTQVIRDGVEWHREHLSSLLGKLHTLQARLQGIYQAMFERYMSTNSTQVGTPQDQTDSWSETWRTVGRAPLLYARGANADPLVGDQLTQGPDNLGRLHYQRPVDQDGQTATYEERGGFYTTLAYLWDWDLHQLRYSYATGTDPYRAADIHDDRVFEMHALDYNKLPMRQWREGSVIELNVADVFTPEFLARAGSSVNGTGGNVFGFGDVNYQNGAGYRFEGLPKLYAYVREVEYLPDGVVRPTAIDILKSPDLTDSNHDGIPDSVVMLNGFLRSITDVTYDFTLRDDYQFNPADGDPRHSYDVNPGIGGSGWMPVGPGSAIYHFDGAPAINLFGEGGNGFDGSVWSGEHWDDGWGFWFLGQSDHYKDGSATMRNFFTIDNDPLRHPTFNYVLSDWLLAIDDYGKLNFRTDVTDWQRLFTDNLGGTAGAGAADQTAISSMSLLQGRLNEFEVYGYNRMKEYWEAIIDRETRYEFSNGDGDGGGGWSSDETPGMMLFSGRDGAAGIRIDNAVWTVRTIRPESAPGDNDGDQDLDGKQRYVVDAFGNIYDTFGAGNNSSDYYDYVLDREVNAKGNYVGNLFGGSSLIGRVHGLDGNNGGPVNGRLDPAESRPLLQFAPRDYNKADDRLSSPGRGTTNAAPVDPWTLAAPGAPPVAPDPHGHVGGRGSAGTVVVDTYNPQFAGAYMGFAEKDHTTIGMAGVARDSYGVPLNAIKVLPLRTGSSVSWHHNPTQGNDLLDREYRAIGAGTQVRILDHFGNLVALGKLSARDPLTGEYTVTDPVDGTGNEVQLDPEKTYTVTTLADSGARSGGSIENQLTQALIGALGSADYRDILKLGLLDDVMLKASAITPFGDEMSGRVTIRYNRQQERIEVYQNAFAAFFKPTLR